MQITRVQTPKERYLFLNLVKLIYQGNEAYVRPLDNDIEAVFDIKKNKYFRHGKAERWIAQDESGRVVGRIAAFVNDKYSKQFLGVGGIGFFESIKDQAIAFGLFDTAKSWLKAQGMQAMDGPINFGERDKFWGLTIENFEQSPYYGQNFNPSYYVDFFENYGFKEYYQQLIYHRLTTDPLQEKFEERAQRLLQDNRYVVKRIDKRNKTKLTNDFRLVYNKAWGKREGDDFVGMSEAQAKSIMNALGPIMDNDLGYFAYFEDVPIGFYIAIPELNAIFKKFDGKFGWWQKVQFLFYLKTGACKSSVGLVFGVDPTYQGKGVEGLIFKHCSERLIEKNSYRDVIITWIGDFNVKMIRIIESLGAKPIQKMATMRYQFDQSIEFVRHPIKI